VRAARQVPVFKPVVDALLMKKSEGWGNITVEQLYHQLEQVAANDQSTGTASVLRRLHTTMLLLTRSTYTHNLKALCLNSYEVSHVVNLISSISHCVPGLPLSAQPSQPYNGFTSRDGGRHVRGPSLSLLITLDSTHLSNLPIWTSTSVWCDYHWLSVSGPTVLTLFSMKLTMECDSGAPA
jgi:hypothetical protein